MKQWLYNGHKMADDGYMMVIWMMMVNDLAGGWAYPSEQYESIGMMMMMMMMISLLNGEMKPMFQTTKKIV